MNQEEKKPEKPAIELSKTNLLMLSLPESMQAEAVQLLETLSKMEEQHRLQQIKEKDNLEDDKPIAPTPETPTETKEPLA